MGTFFATHEAELYHYGRKGMRRGRHLPDVLDPTRELIGKMVPTRSNINARQMTGRDAQIVRGVKNKVTNPARISGADADIARRFYDATKRGTSSGIKSNLKNNLDRVKDASRNYNKYENQNFASKGVQKAVNISKGDSGEHKTAADYLARRMKVNATRMRVSQRQAAEINRIRKEQEEHDNRQRNLNRKHDLTITAQKAHDTVMKKKQLASEKSAINAQKAHDTVMKKKKLASEKAASVRKDISSRTSEGIAKAMTVGSSTKKAIKKSEKRIRSDARKEKFNDTINSLKNKHETKRRKKLYNKTHDGSAEERAPYATANRASSKPVRKTVNSEYQRNLDANSGKKSKVSASIGDVLSAKQRRKLQKRLDRSEELSRSDVPFPQYQLIQAEAYNKALRKRAYEQKEADKKAEFEKRKLNHKKQQEKYIREQKELADFWQEDQRKVEREKDELKRRKLNNRR